MSRARELDQYFTTSAVARHCLDQLNSVLADMAGCAALLQDPVLWYLEPSAGEGAFFDLLPRATRLGLDLEPRHPAIQQANFLEFRPAQLPPFLVTVGNPPFGVNYSMAVRFFNHAAQFSQVIAFILPMAFRKESTIRRLNPLFALVSDEALPAKAFVFQGQPYSVPCCFQIWVKQSMPRIHEPEVRHHADFEFVGAGDADFAIRRVGRRAGCVLNEFSGYARTSHHFIRVLAPRVAVKAVFGAIDWSAEQTRSTGSASIGKPELVRRYEAERVLGPGRGRG